MTDKQIIAACLVAYEQAVKIIEPMPFDLAFVNCMNLRVYDGVCLWIGSYIYNIESELTFIKKYISVNGLYWYATPEDAETKEQLVDRLNYRIGILKKELEEQNAVNPRLPFSI